MKSSMTWKTSTFLLAVLLVSVSVACYVITSSALHRESAAVHAREHLLAENITVRKAIHDTQSFLNFFRLTDSAQMTPADYQRQIEKLQSMFATHFPEWEKSQKKIEFEPTAGGE